MFGEIDRLQNMRRDAARDQSGYPFDTVNMRFDSTLRVSASTRSTLGMLFTFLLFYESRNAFTNFHLESPPLCARYVTVKGFRRS